MSARRSVLAAPVARALVAASAGVTLFVAGCAAKVGPSSIRVEPEREHITHAAMVESVRTITIDRARLPVAVIAGSGSGAMPSLRGSADRSVPSGDSEASARTGAATSNTRVQAVEVTVRLDNGEPRAVVQDPDQKFAVGERVRLVYEGGEVRLIR